MAKREDGPSSAVRIRVMKRDRFLCTYCGVSGNDAELEVDHIIPVSKGGSHHMSNLTTACRKCNQAKGANVAKPLRAVIENGGRKMIGMFLHTLGESGEIIEQGYIVDSTEDFFMVQLFSWITGDQTEVRPFDKNKLLNGGAIFYQKNEDMIKDYWKRTEKQGGILNGRTADELYISNMRTNWGLSGNDMKDCPY